MARAVAAMGRPSIFRDKVGGDRVQGNITPRGSQRFERHRKRLAKLYREVTHLTLEVESVSDADVIEYLARGEADTRGYLERTYKTSAGALS